MSATRSTEADSGHDHVVPFLVAVALAAAVLAVSLAFTGLPH